MPRPHKFIPLLSAFAVLLVAGLQGPAPAATPTQANAPDGQLQIWNANLHSGAPDTDYRNFLSYIADPANAAYSPDLVTVQEVGTHISSTAHLPCSTVVSELESRTGRNYECVATNAQGNAAIIYRPSRLEFVTRVNFGLYKVDAAANCILQTGNSWKGIAAGFRDTRTNKYVVASSLHLPVAGAAGQPECALRNSRTAEAQIEAIASSLPGAVKARVMAGDWNTQDTLTPQGTQPTWEFWYKCVNTDLSGLCTSSGGPLTWKDAMARSCGTLSTSPTTWLAVHDCLRISHGTHGSSQKQRIDFLFTKAYSIHHQTTVPFEDAHADSMQDYSDHRGQGALITLY